MKYIINGKCETEKKTLTCKNHYKDCVSIVFVFHIVILRTQPQSSQNGGHRISQEADDAQSGCCLDIS